jgi:hypothetical protein
MQAGQNQDQMKIGLQQPIIGYLTKAGRLYPIFVIKSPLPMYCSDCINYILTLSIPFPSGTERHTVAFNSQYNFENPNDAKIMQTLLGLIENLEESNYSQQQLPLY